MNGPVEVDVGDSADESPAEKRLEAIDSAGDIRLWPGDKKDESSEGMLRDCNGTPFLPENGLGLSNWKDEYEFSKDYTRA